MKYPFVRQHDEKDCGAACLSMICQYHGKKLRLAKLREKIKVDNCGANIYGIVTGAQELGFCAEALEGDFQELKKSIQSGEIKLPFIARILNEYGYEHYIVIYKIGVNKITIGDPAKASISTMNIQTFAKQWLGHIITFEPSEKFTLCNERKGAYSRYVNAIFSQKKLFISIFLISILISSINVASSVVFQYVLNSTELVEEETQINEETHINEETVDENHHHDSEVEIGSSDKKYGRVLTILDKAKSKVDIVFKNISTVCISIIILYILSCIIQVLRGYMMAQTAKKVNVPLALGYYKHLMKLPFNFFENRKTGELMSRFSDIKGIRDAISSMALSVIFDCLMTIACGCVLLYISIELFFITLTVVFVLLLVVILFKKHISNVNYDHMDSDAQLTAFMKESIDGVATIKAYQCEKNMSNKITNLFDKYMGYFVKGSVIYSLQDTIINTIISIGTIILLWQGTELCVLGSISIADLLIYYYLLSFYINPIKNLIILQPEFQTALVAMDRLNDVFDAEVEEITESQTILEKVNDIKISNVDFRYGNRELVLKKINMQVKKGSKIAIVGESGSGKTTLAKLLLNFYSPEKGDIFYDGKSIKNFSVSSIRERIAFVSQDIFLFSDSIYNNLTLGDETINKDKVEEVCSLCKIHEFILEQPLGYNTILEENGVNLSGGQKQRLAIARAILHQPDVLVFDEATCHLDSLTENEIQKAIVSACKDRICIFIAHSLRTIKNCDYIYVMQKGEIVEEGKHENLIQGSGLYASLFNTP